MERNSDDLLGGTTQGGASSGSTGGSGTAGAGFGNASDVSGTGGYGSVGGGTGDAGMSGTSGIGSTTGAGTSGGFGAGSGTESAAGNVADKARDLAGNAQERLADVGSTVKERAGEVGSTVKERAGQAKNSLADMLETGAERLRQRTQGGAGAQLGEIGADGSATAADSRVAQVSGSLAGGLQSTADWLREADMQSLQTGIERQVKEHPGRTLLIAAGVGYLLGKAFRR